MASPVDLGAQVDQVNPDPLYFHPRGFQVLGLLWVCLGGSAARIERRGVDCWCSSCFLPCLVVHGLLTMNNMAGAGPRSADQTKTIGDG